MWYWTEGEAYEYDTQFCRGTAQENKKRAHGEQRKRKKAEKFNIFTGDSFVFMSCCVRACHTKYNVITKLPFETKESGNWPSDFWRCCGNVCEPSIESTY